MRTTERSPICHRPPAPSAKAGLRQGLVWQFRLFCSLYTTRDNEMA
jgi:hypothetical protein